MGIIDFEPRPMQPGMEQPEPAVPEMGDPQWVLDTWRKLYYNFPSSGLKQRVSEVEDWVQKRGGDGLV